MADFTPVLPASMFAMLDPPHERSVHFLHAPQLLGPHGDDIIRRYKDRSCRFIIDCFAYEHPGLVPDTAAVYEVAQLLKGKIRMTIVCPDVLRRADLTMALLRRHGPALGGYGRLMIVPHGDSIVEWMVNCERMLSLCFKMGIDQPYIGLPRYLTEFGMETRNYLACWVGFTYRHCPVHLLGAGAGLAEVIGAAQVPNVQSCDSTLPFAWTYVKGSIYTDPIAKVEMPEEAWELEGLHPRTDLIRYMQLNISIWKERLRRASITSAFWQ